MSNRSMLEFNHDFSPREKDLLAWAKQLRLYLNSGDPELLPPGVTYFGRRHHSDPCPLGDPPRGWDNDRSADEKFSPADGASETDDAAGWQAIKYAPAGVMMFLARGNRVTYGRFESNPPEGWCSIDGGFTRREPPTHWMSAPKKSWAGMKEWVREHGLPLPPANPG